jgi:hypothetical protein
VTTALSIIGGIVLLLGAGTQIPAAIADLMRACVPLAAAFRELRDAFRGNDET